MIAQLLAASPPAADTLEAWWQATASARDELTAPIDRAIVGGALADRLGFAFASGYAEALRALVPGTGGITALCATEEGGAHPRAIRTTLANGRLSGHKRWATVASAASTLLVVATTGEVDGRPQLRVCRVRAGAPGVTIRATTAPFVPEIPHAEVTLEGVAVSPDDILPGDGYDAYLKPFRTVEDIHVHAALLGYLAGVARRRDWPAFAERCIALALSARALAAEDASSPATHLALAGLIELARGVVTDVETAWASVPDDEHARWLRDRPLLQVASKARVARLERARELLYRVR